MTVKIGVDAGCVISVFVVVECFLCRRAGKSPERVVLKSRREELLL
jgi:hypothetical protein